MCHKNGNLISCPGLNTCNLLRFLPPSIATAFGHIVREINNLQSTSPETTIGIEDIQDSTHIPDQLKVKSYYVCALVIPFTMKQTGYVDHTGGFFFMSIQGNTDIIVLNDYDSNAILSEPLKNHQEATIRDVFWKLHAILQAQGNNPNLYIMDN